MIFRKKVTNKLRLIAALTLIEQVPKLTHDEVREIAHMGLQKCDYCRDQFDKKWLPKYYNLISEEERLCF